VDLAIAAKKSTQGGSMPADQSTRAQALARLAAFVGEWTEQVTLPGAAPVQARGRTVFEWGPGGQFLLERSQWPDPDFPDSLAIIAASPDGASYTRHYFDSRGVVRIYAMSFRDGIWTLVRDAPDFTPLQFAQRFTGRFTDDGSVIHGAWETAGDGERWEHDFDLTYTKLT
jgi:hypothetical protein